jgi:hypothetical protein
MPAEGQAEGDSKRTSEDDVLVRMRSFLESVDLVPPSA